MTEQLDDFQDFMTSGLSTTNPVSRPNSQTEIVFKLAFNTIAADYSSMPHRF